MTNERPDLCASCGECCRTRPGAEEPAPFLRAADPAGAIAAALASGDWVVARHAGMAWDGDAPPPEADRWRPVRYLRPATLAERGTRAAAPGAEGSPCVFLGAGGCRLPFDGRPRMCRELEPWANGECVAAWDLPHAARAWAPWQGLIDDALGRLPQGPPALRFTPAPPSRTTDGS